MILLDAYALVAFLGAEPAASEVRELLRTEECGITSLNLAEAADVLGRIHGVDIEITRGLVSPLALPVLAVDEALAWRAAALRARHYRRGSREASLADCVLVAAARGDADAIATADPAVIAMAAEEGVAVHTLPDRRGRRPT